MGHSDLCVTLDELMENSSMLCLLDVGDSTGQIMVNEVLHVDIYFKKQILLDKKNI